jgi:hypothetical protein
MVKKSKPKFTIRTPQIPADKRGLHFSFQYLQLDHPRFPVEQCPVKFFIALFTEIKRYQTFSIDQFKECSPDDHRHPIIWMDTQEPDGFPNIDPTQDETWTDDCWQFGLPCKRKSDPARLWRVYGFIANGAFFVVWLDPMHALDS